MVQSVPELPVGIEMRTIWGSIGDRAWCSWFAVFLLLVVWSFGAIEVETWDYLIASWARLRYCHELWLVAAFSSIPKRVLKLIFLDGLVGFHKGSKCELRWSVHPNMEELPKRRLHQTSVLIQIWIQAVFRIPSSCQMMRPNSLIRLMSASISLIGSDLTVSLPKLTS